MALCLFPASELRAEDGEAGRDLYILSAGVEAGLEDSSGDLNGRDATYIRQALVAAEPLYQNVYSRLLPGKRATRDAVMAGLAWLAERVRPQDVAVIFFAGHGDVSAEGHHLYLAGGPGQEAGKPAIHGPELKAAVARIRGHAIVLMDSCGAGALFAPAGALPDETRATWILSCQGQELSAGQAERADRPSGFFVIAFCEALSGLADIDQDRVVTLGEVGDYLPGRAQALWQSQHAVVVRQPTAELLPLAQVNHASSPQQLWTPQRWRNPFGWPDVIDPDGGDVMAFGRENPLPGGADDANAAAWAEGTVEAAAGIEGKWSSRWSKKASPAQWWAGTAEVRTIRDRVYIMYQEKSGRRHLIEATRVGDSTLVGRYVDIINRRDSTPWVGRIIDHERIDGQWAGGRWDLRRTFAP